MDGPLKHRLDLTHAPLVGVLLRSRWPQFAARAITLAGFLFTILAGFFGSPVGSHNFAILFVWIAWWTALKVFFIPLGGRSWCSICPIPAAGEWMQQGWILRPSETSVASGASGKGFGLQKRWPKLLRNSWIQAGSFLAIGLFSAVTLTTPAVTAWVFLGLILTAAAVSLIFERRSFCQYVCPMGGFIGWYARVAPVELRVKDRAVCAAHTDKTCYTGCAEGAGCPWGTLPTALQANNACGLCMECLHTCPKDNVIFNLRPFGGDLNATAPRKWDDAWLGMILLGCVLAFSAVFQGTWGALKTVAFQVFSPGWFVYAGLFLLAILGVLPGLFAASVWAGQRLSGSNLSLRKAFVAQVYALIPLGFCAWLGFTLSFSLAKFAYVWPVLSDPFGWGWNLFGTAGMPWAPYLPGLTPMLVVLVLTGGLAWTGKSVIRTARETLPAPAALRMAAPLMLFSFAFVLLELWILI